MRKHYLGFLALTALPWVSTVGNAFQPPVAAGGVAAPATASDDAEAIKKSAREFAEAFNKHDAKAIAGMYTENGEAREADGQILIGRAAIEKAYADYFKASSTTTIDVMVKSVRFPSKDMAVEQGILRLSRGPKALPETTTYVVIHAREAGVWKMAISTESGGGVDRLEDLEWLLGDWNTKAPAGDITFSFKRDPKRAVIIGTFTRTPTGKEPLSGSIRIAADPETGKIRSWGFEDDGAHSQGLWFNDGKSWIIDIRAVTADGAPAAERILLQRVTPDAITWRGVDRMLGDSSLADTPPLRLTRKAAGAASTK